MNKCLFLFYTECPECFGTAKYLGKYTFLRKIFQIKDRIQSDVFSDVNNLILSCIIKVRSKLHQFIRMKTFLIAYSCYCILYLISRAFQDYNTVFPCLKRKSFFPRLLVIRKDL